MRFKSQFSAVLQDRGEPQETANIPWRPWKNRIDHSQNVNLPRPSRKLTAAFRQQIFVEPRINFTAIRCDTKLNTSNMMAVTTIQRMTSLSSHIQGSPKRQAANKLSKIVLNRIKTCQWYQLAVANCEFGEFCLQTILRWRFMYKIYLISVFRMQW